MVVRVDWVGSGDDHFGWVTYLCGSDDDEDAETTDHYAVWIAGAAAGGAGCFSDLADLVDVEGWVQESGER